MKCMLTGAVSLMMAAVSSSNTTAEEDKWEGWRERERRKCRTEVVAVSAVTLWYYSPSPGQSWAEPRPPSSLGRRFEGAAVHYLLAVGCEPRRVCPLQSRAVQWWVCL